MSFNIRLDVDPVVICAYNKNHRIARSRIQKHLIKCEKKFLSDYKQQCPYDATHRVFEHEMVEHVTVCNMKFKNLNLHDNYNIKLPDFEQDNKIEPDKSWDEDHEIQNEHNAFNEPIFEQISIKQYTNNTPHRDNFLLSKPNHSNLRRTYSYTESMLDINSENNDDDLQSVTSEIGIGRGQYLRLNRGQYVRGSNRMYRRYLRSR